MGSDIAGASAPAVNDGPKTGYAGASPAERGSTVDRRLRGRRSPAIAGLAPRSGLSPVVYGGLLQANW
jgi:hypothetical protein